MQVIIRGDVQKHRAIEVLSSLTPDPQKPMVMELKAYDPDKTSAQRGMWHAILAELAAELGYTKAEMKSEIKRAVLGTHEYTGLDGTTREREASSEDERRSGYSDLIAHTLRIAAELGVPIRDPRR